MEIIKKYFPELTEKQLGQIEMLEGLYREWNAKINLISRKDIDNLFQNHILHSLSIAKIISFGSDDSVMDIGTGGGLPGIPLAIYFPESRFYLTDSIGKKIRVANAIISELKLENAEAEQVRAEEVKAKFTFAVSRAVAEMPKIYGWAKDKIMKNKKGEDGNGLICLKGGDLTEELRPFRGKAEVISLADYFEEEYFNDKKAVYIRFN